MIIIQETRIKLESIDSYSIEKDGYHDRFLCVILKSGSVKNFKFTMRNEYDRAITRLDDLLGNPKHLLGD